MVPFLVGSINIMNLLHKILAITLNHWSVSL